MAENAKAIAKRLRDEARGLEADAKRLKAAAQILDPKRGRGRPKPKIETEPKATISQEDVLGVLRNGSATVQTILKDLNRDDPVAFDEVKTILAQLTVRNEVEKFDGGYYTLAPGVAN